MYTLFNILNKTAILYQNAMIKVCRHVRLFFRKHTNLLFLKVTFLRFTLV